MDERRVNMRGVGRGGGHMGGRGGGMGRHGGGKGKGGKGGKGKGGKGKDGKGKGGRFDGVYIEQPSGSYIEDDSIFCPYVNKACEYACNYEGGVLSKYHNPEYDYCPRVTGCFRGDNQRDNAWYDCTQPDGDEYIQPMHGLNINAV